MNKNHKIGYVILHYQALEETRACVSTILKILAGQDIVIIVDNHSPNGSGEVLYREFLHTSGVTVILNAENLGFAQGNNVGYAMAKHQYNCDFIVMLNNDTLVRQTDFRDRILAAYNAYRFAVMGPKILCADGTVNPCSPSVPIHTNVRRAKVGQISNYIRYLFSICNLDILAGRILDRRLQTGNLKTEFYQENVQIAGCCLIFSKEYIDQFEGLNSGTFMYLEETILYIMVKKAGLKMIYNPALEIVHSEDAATLETFNGKSRKARQFKYKCQMQSFKVLLDEIGRH